VNLKDHVRRSIVAAAVATSVAIAVGAAGAAHADTGLPQDSVATESPPGATADDSPPGPGAGDGAAAGSTLPATSSTSSPTRPAATDSTVAPTTNAPASTVTTSTTEPPAAIAPSTTPPATTSAATGTAAAQGPTPDAAQLNVLAVSAPTAPRAPVATPANTRVKLTWRRPSSNGGATIDKYVVRRATSKSGPWTKIAYPTSRSYMAIGLTNGTRYYFRIRAHNRAGWGPSSTAVDAVPRKVPTAPRSPVATPGNGSVKLTWRRPSSNGGATINKYRVRRATSSTGPWTNIAYPKTRSHTAIGLTGGTRYYFRIAAHNAAGWSPPSTVVNAVPLPQPSAPRSPTVTPGNESAPLTWLAPSSTGGSPIDKYAVQQAPSAGGPWTTISEPTTLNYTATALTNGTPYYFQVAAHNAAGWGPYSTVVTSIPMTVPTAPQTPSAQGGDASVTLAWLAPSNTGGATVDRYEVQQATSGGGPWATIAEPTTLGHSATGLSNGTSYFFQVRAHNAAGWGPYSTVASAIPMTVPSAPYKPQATAGDGSVQLTWGSPPSNGGSAIDGYKVTRATNWWAGPWTTYPAGKALSYNFTGLANGTTYFFRVWAHNAAGWSAPSYVVDATPYTVPSAPAACSAVQPPYGVGVKALDVDWNPPASNGGAPITKYEIQLTYYFGGGFIKTEYEAGDVTHHKLWVPALGEPYSVRIAAHNAAGGSPWCTADPAVPW
jgi:predicted phage tail protein